MWNLLFDDKSINIILIKKPEIESTKIQEFEGFSLLGKYTYKPLSIITKSPLWSGKKDVVITDGHEKWTLKNAEVIETNLIKFTDCLLKYINETKI